MKQHYNFRNEPTTWSNLMKIAGCSDQQKGATLHI